MIVSTTNAASLLCVQLCTGILQQFDDGQMLRTDALALTAGHTIGGATMSLTDETFVECLRPELLMVQLHGVHSPESIRQTCSRSILPSCSGSRISPKPSFGIVFRSMLMPLPP